MAHLYDGQTHLGYAFEEEDRDALHAMTVPFTFAAKASDDLPEKVDPEEWGLIIHSQGAMGSCRGHSLTTGAESILYWEHGLKQQDIQLSPLWAYTQTQAIDRITGDRGSTIRGGFELAKSRGICTEQLCPYPNPVRYPSGFRPSAAAVEDAATRKMIGATVNIKAAPNPFQAALEWIGAYGYVDIGMSWSISLDSRGVVTRFGGSSAGGHAIAATGYIPDGNGNKLIKVANSHGDRYGKSGYFYCSEAIWNQIARHQYTEMIGATSYTSPTRKLRAWSPDQFSIMG